MLIKPWSPPVDGTGEVPQTAVQPAAPPAPSVGPRFVLPNYGDAPQAPAPTPTAAPKAPEPKAEPRFVLPTYDDLVQGTGPTPREIWPQWQQNVIDQISLGIRNRSMLETAAASGRSMPEIERSASEEQAKKVLANGGRYIDQLDDSEFERFQLAFQAELRNQPKAPDSPTPPAPSIAQAMLAALAMALNPRFASDIGATPFLANRQAAEDEAKRRQADYQNSYQGWQDRVAGLQRMVGFEADRLDRRQRGYDAAENRAARKEQADLIAGQRNDTLAQREFDDAATAYAKVPSTTALARFNAARQKLKLPPVGEAEHGENTAVYRRELDRRESVNRSGALQAWKDAKRDRILMGEITDDDAATLNTKVRADIARAYGVDIGVMPEVVSGRTLQAQALEQRKTQFDRTFAQRGKQWTDRMAATWASLDVAKDRLQLARELGWAQNDVARYGVALRAYDLAGARVNKEADKEITKIDSEIAGLDARIATARPGEKRVLMDRRAELDGQKAYWETQKVEDVDAAATGSSDLEVELAPATVDLGGLNLPMMPLPKGHIGPAPGGPAPKKPRKAPAKPAAKKTPGSGWSTEVK